MDPNKPLLKPLHATDGMSRNAGGLIFSAGEQETEKQKFSWLKSNQKIKKTPPIIDDQPHHNIEYVKRFSRQDSTSELVTDKTWASRGIWQ